MILRGTFLSLLSVATLTGAGLANTGKAMQAPAETPPASFSGTQFVDAAGCAFIRAEFGGETRWLPRLNPDRTHICGLEPSLEAKTAKAIVETPAASAPEQQVAAPAVSPVTASKASPMRPRPASTHATASTRAPVQRASQTVRVTCPSRSGTSYSYIAQPGDLIRCDRTGAPAEAALVLASGDAANEVAKPIYKLPKPPSGYRYAFGEGRHNPNRGERTLAGTAEMNRVWTQDVPRKLVSPEAGQIGLEIQGYRSTQTGKTTYRASSKAQVAPSQRNVQVASFREAANASATAGRLQARGLPVRITVGRNGGKKLYVVIAGPFESQARTQAALNKTRSIGYSDAFIRR
ncbi:SPOR domain-containing protein [Aliiruegeria lutimaris]|uniref:Sporulation related domain-containing protein n=1 Tax=Aliiruegeria lutimaris TaxID=571298 RepID=A0A1G9E7J8_9RHOB|nr:SPOR domain-containing protein [Aliiruegeria lutimaris]SDK72112.1 Sporulation related domain-containing protein [Aliiruegeria lutimaris]